MRAKELLELQCLIWVGPDLVHHYGFANIVPNLQALALITGISPSARNLITSPSPVSVSVPPSDTTLTIPNLSSQALRRPLDCPRRPLFYPYPSPWPTRLRHPLESANLVVLPYVFFNASRGSPYAPVIR